MTYTELKQAIQDYASNYEPSFISHIDQFIQMTEKRIVNDAQLPLEQSSTTMSTVVGVATLNVGAVTGYIAVDSIAVVVSGAYSYLDNKEEEYLRTAFPNLSTLGKPRLYTVYDHQTLKVAPTPDAIYSVELRYTSYPTSIVTSITSWLGTNYEFALLYGSMRDAAIYLKEEPDVVAMYEGKYAEAMGQVKTFAKDRASVDSYRTRGSQ
jgi:hypothetical protein